MSFPWWFWQPAAASTSYPPALRVEVAFASAPLAASPSWTDVSQYVDSATMRRGRSHELGRVDRGAAKIVVDDADRRFDPLNTASPYAPNVLPLRKVRITLDDGVTAWRRFVGFVERYPYEWDAPGYEYERALECSDGFEILAAHELVTAQATLTTSLGIADADLTFTARGGGVAGNEISIEYVVMDRPTYQATAYLASEVNRLRSAETGRIIVVLGTTGLSGPVVTSAQQVMTAIRANPSCDALVEVSIPEGQSGLGLVTSMARTFLTGGEYVQELSSTRIGNVLDDVGWPSGSDHRALQTGQYAVAAASFAEQDRQSGLDHVQDTIEAEGGVFFIDGAGKATSHDVHYRWKGAKLTPAAVFGDAGGSEIPYEAGRGNFDRDEIVTEARIEYAGGQEPEIYANATAQTNYGKRTVSQSLSLVSRHAAEARASYIVEAFASPKLRLDSISVMPMASSTYWAALLPLEIGDRVTVKRRPPEHPAGSAVVISQDYFIESVELTVGREPAQTVFTFGLTPVPWDSFWVLGDSTYGKLGQTSRLGY